MQIEIIYKDLSYSIIGLCMEAYNVLGKGHSEVTYKNALEFELTENKKLFSREKQFKINYKGILLPNYYNADFVVEDKIILEVKAVSCLTDSHIKQTLNYLAISKYKLGLLVNFGEDSLVNKRIVL